MRNVYLIILAVSLAGCNSTRLAAFRQCERDYPRASAGNPLLAMGAVGGVIAGSLDDPNKPARDGCYQAAVAAN